MGHINFPLREFYNGAAELVAIKSGIILNRFKIGDYLREKFDEDYLQIDQLDKNIRIASSTMTDMVIYLRQRLGNLPPQLPIMNDYHILNEYTIREKDILITGIPSIAYHLIKSSQDENKEGIIEQLMVQENIDKKLATACFNIGAHTLDTSISIDSGKVWDNATPLSELFKIEIKPKNNEDFIEQKFIDYLALNGHEIEIIHWRNFERLCAEYFRRLGYHAVLGPGTNDGGVDIRVYPNSDNLATALLLIQCKRYSGEHKVTIETVKSFYTDVFFEGAKEGIIATTGYIAEGGKKIVKARKYNIKFSEKENVKQWTNQMKSWKT
ncbi:hypothetical protein BWD42_11730 [Sphingobacterium sp. CZ-UAM]|uniref:restriction endonuclease n=1 Tax=Sphingobacterium sp. CZ-UAM TaxID=1933868 RepID=UPI000984FC9A|nr:restriction endonuclease [Sphingobacterium sp. CZ-UAM]OOG17961.1 hypothetical protein BWD42_11730 [Sphingobacterium sp. CZ-UAM]